MKLRFLGLLTITWAICAVSASADVILVPPKAQPPGERPSHRPIAGGLESNMTPEQLLAARLARSRGKLGEEKIDDDMKALFGKLLEDKEFLKSLSKSLKPEDIARMKNALRDDAKRFADDPNLKKLVEGMKDDPDMKKLVEGMKNEKLTDADRQLLEQWKEKNKDHTDPGSKVNPNEQTDPNIRPNTTTQPPTQPGQMPTIPPVQQPRDNGMKMPEWAKKNLDQSARDFSKWLDSPNGKAAADRFRDAAKRFAEARNNSAVGERVKGVGRYLPRPGNWITRMPSRPTPNLSGLPRLPSAGSMPSVSASGAGKSLVIVAVVAFLLFVLWYSRGWVKDAVAARLAKTWKLGPWPVRPDQVSTRADLVRAFEYLALLCLGPAARAHHHLDLGQEIAGQPSLDPDRRRDAAETLARLYEQARYTPDDEPLSPKDLADARRELKHLAGEQAA